MSTNPDINMAQGFVTSEPTGDGIKLYANDVDITDEVGGGEAGYTVEESMSAVVPEQSTTTVEYGGANLAQLVGSLDGVSAGDSCVVTYNGTEYDVEAQELSGNIYFGETSGQGPDFSNYPFLIFGMQDAVMMYASSANPTLKIEAVVSSVVPSETFIDAVTTSMGNPVFPHIVKADYDNMSQKYMALESFSDVLDALDAISVPVQLYFRYGRFNGLLISLEAKHASNNTTIQGFFLLDELRTASATTTNMVTLYKVVWSEEYGIEIATQRLETPSE